MLDVDLVGRTTTESPIRTEGRLSASPGTSTESVVSGYGGVFVHGAYVYVEIISIREKGI